MERISFYYDTKSGKKLFIDKNYVTKEIKIQNRKTKFDMILSENEKKEINSFLDNLKRTDLVRTYFY